MATFVPGRELAAALYEVVAPLLGTTTHSAGHLGWGSDVLGFDTARSTDHGWGPRLVVLVAPEDVAAAAAAVERGLPETVRGLPTRFGWDDVPVGHHVDVSAPGDWFGRRLGFDPRGGVSTDDWLTAPQQLLLEVTRGTVFHDGLGELEPARALLAWYPRDVWLWALGCQWWRISQEEPFPGRAAEVGDELGSRVLAARLVRDAVRLAFLLERRYAPYAKWLGSGFAQLELATDVGPPLARVLAADTYEARETAWVHAIETLARGHNALGLTERVDPTVRSFHSRPFKVIGAERFAEACFATVADERLRALPRVGTVDQVTDSTDVLSASSVARAFRAFYREAT